MRERLNSHVGWVETHQILGITLQHQGLNCRVVMGDQVSDEEGSRRAEPLVEAREHRLPLRLLAQMMQHLAGEDEVE